MYSGNDVSSTVSKQLTKKELKRFQDLLDERRRAVLDRARKTLSEDMTLDTNDLPDEMDLAASEYIQSFEFRLRGREKMLLTKIDNALRIATRYADSKHARIIPWEQEVNELAIRRPRGLRSVGRCCNTNNNRWLRD